jgi:hypothetical protein
MTMRRVALVAASLLTACATTEKMGDRVNPEVPAWFARSSGDLSVFARRKLTSEAKQTGEGYERGRPELDAVRNRVFVGSSDHGLYALRSSNLSTIWRFETAGMVQSEPTYDRELDVVFFGSNDGGLYALRASDGTLVWRFDTGSEVTKKPLIDGESLVFANASDQLFSIDRRTGKLLWQARRAPAAGMELAGYAGPTIDRGKVYFAYSDGHVGAYDLRDGSERWAPVDLAADAEQHPGGQEQRYLDVDTTPVVADVPGTGRVVFVASYAGGIYALDAETGARVWSNDKALGVTDLVYWTQPAHAPHPKGPDSDGPAQPEKRMLFASSAQTGLWAMDPANGKQVWRKPLPDGGITAPAIVAGALVFGTSRFGLFLMAPDNGKVIDAIDSGTGFVATPAAYGNRVFALSNGGVLYGIAIDAPLGKRL